MSEEPRNSKLKKFEKFTRSKLAMFGIPLLTIVAVTFHSFKAGIGLLTFCLVVWTLSGFIGKTSEFSGKSIAKNTDPASKKRIREAIGATWFLGAFAIISIVLRSDKTISNSIRENLPKGMSLSLIDPFFAVFCIVCVWAYVIYRSRN